VSARCQPIHNRCQRHALQALPRPAGRGSHTRPRGRSVANATQRASRAGQSNGPGADKVRDVRCIY